VRTILLGVRGTARGRVPVREAPRHRAVVHHGQRLVLAVPHEQHAAPGAAVRRLAQQPVREGQAFNHEA
jgi:hypothetical protein